MMVRDPVKKAYFRYFRRKVAWVLSSCLIFIAVNPVCNIALASEGGESVETVSEAAAPQDDTQQSTAPENDAQQSDVLQKEGKREVLSENNVEPDTDSSNDKDIIRVRIPTNFNIPMYNIGSGVEVRSDDIEIINESDFPVDVYVTSVSASFIETGNGIIQAKNGTNEEYKYDTSDMENYSNLTLSLRESGGKESISILKGGCAEDVMKFTLGVSEDAVKRSASANAGRSVSEENIPEEKVSENTAAENDGSEEQVSANDSSEADEEEVISDNELPDETSDKDESVSDEPENNEPESEEQRVPADETSGESDSEGDASVVAEGEKDTGGEDNHEEAYDSGIWIETLEATPSDEPLSDDNKVFREVLDDSDFTTGEDQESIINNPEHEGSEIIQVTYKTELVKQDDEEKDDEPDEDVSGNDAGDEKEDSIDGGAADEGSTENETTEKDGTSSEESREETIQEDRNEPDSSDSDTGEIISAVSDNETAKKDTEEQESDNKDTDKPALGLDENKETVSDNEGSQDQEQVSDQDSLSENKALTEEKTPEPVDTVSENSQPETEGKLSLDDLVSGNIINNTVFNENGKRKVVGEDYEEDEEKDSRDNVTKSSGVSVIGQDRAVLNLNGSMLSGLNTGGIGCKIETNITFDFVKHEDTGDAEDVKDTDISESDK